MRRVQYAHGLTFTLGRTRCSLELRIVLLKRIQIRLQLFHRLLVGTLLLARLHQLVFEVDDRVRLLLARLHAPLHELDLDTRLLDLLVACTERARERLHLIIELRDLTLSFNIDSSGGLDFGDAENPRCGPRDYESFSRYISKRGSWTYSSRRSHVPLLQVVACLPPA